MFPLIPGDMAFRYFLGWAVIPLVSHHLPPGIHHPITLSAGGILPPPWVASDKSRSLCHGQKGLAQNWGMLSRPTNWATLGREQGQEEASSPTLAPLIYLLSNKQLLFSHLPTHSCFFSWHCQKRVPIRAMILDYLPYGHVFSTQSQVEMLWKQVSKLRLPNIIKKPLDLLAGGKTAAFPVQLQICLCHHHAQLFSHKAAGHAQGK